MKVIRVLILLSPVGVWSLVLAGAARFDVRQMGLAMLALLTAVLSSLSLHLLIVCPTLLAIGARRDPIKYFRHCLPALLVALGSSSSAATLPVNIDVALERQGG